MQRPVPYSDHTWVLRLHRSETGACAGQLEHLLSGRCHDFDDADALLACLRHEQQQVQRQTPAAEAP
jgi:hypothetical protein